MENQNMVLTEKQHKYQHYYQLKLKNVNIVQVEKYYFLIKAMFIYSPLRKAFEKQIKNNRRSTRKRNKGT